MIIILAEHNLDMTAIGQAEAAAGDAGLFPGRVYAVMRVVPGKIPVFGAARRDGDDDGRPRPPPAMMERYA